MTKDNEFQLTGNVSYSVKKQYKWLTEPGACAVCKAMHGKLYDKDNVPKKPHPNCRCHVEEVSIIDPKISIQYDFREEFALLKIDALKLLGDLNFAKNNLDKKIVNLQNKEIAKEKEQLSKEIKNLENQINKLSDELNSHSVIIGIDYIQNKSKTTQELRQQISQLNRKIDDLRIKSKRVLVDDLVKLGEKTAPDAAALWKLAATKFKEGTDYIKKNGYLVNKVSDLKNDKLEDAVRKKLKSQNLKTELRGIVLYANSSLAQSLVNSSVFNKYLSENAVKLALNDKLPNSSLSYGFLNSKPNNSLAIHNCDIIEIYLDKQNTMQAKIIDTVDYNLDEPWVAIPHEVQEYGLLENYYVIVEISIPYERWKKFLE